MNLGKKSEIQYRTKRSTELCCNKMKLKMTRNKLKNFVKILRRCGQVWGTLIFGPKYGDRLVSNEFWRLFSGCFEPEGGLSNLSDWKQRCVFFPLKKLYQHKFFSHFIKKQKLRSVTQIHLGKMWKSFKGKCASL